jgi:hypothetical protein
LVVGPVEGQILALTASWWDGIPVIGVTILPRASRVQRPQAFSRDQYDEVVSRDISSGPARRDDLQNHPLLGGIARQPQDLVALAAVRVVLPWLAETLMAKPYDRSSATGTG